MKKLSILILFVLICIPSIFAAKLIVKLEAPDHAPGQNYGFGYTEYAWNLKPWRAMDEMLLSEDGIFEVELPTGCYDLVMLHPTANKVKYNIFVPDSDEEIELIVQMDRLSIPEKIEFIAPMGNFNNHTLTEDQYLIYNSENNSYTLPESMLDTPIDQIYFRVNKEKTVHIPSLPTTEYDVWASLSNVITDGNSSIVFRPDEFRRGDAEHKISGSGADSVYYAIHTKLKDIALILNQTLYTAMRKSNNLDSIISLRNAYYDELLTFKKKVPEKYRWLFLESEYMFVEKYHPANMKLAFYSIKENRQMREKVRKSPGYYQYQTEKVVLAHKLIENSPWLPTYIYEDFDRLDNDLFRYSMCDDTNVPPGYFTNFMNHVLETSNNDQVCGTILYDRAQSLSYMFEHKAIEQIDIIKTKHPEYKGLHDGSIDMFLKKFKITEGIAAPDFSIETLCGETFKLSENKGKFVLIDFWGTWCGPCVGEVPHLIELAKSIPDDQLVIIGLSVNDTEDKLNNFIAEKKINYKNAMCNKEIQQEFGVNSFPTTFLIDKEGNIVAKNLRGDLINQVTAYMNK
ncbi:MAG: TlpA disulfide reductase family protein [Prolixibacteraceae bacterium]|jgi:thiol-disulfide isomerase/thioredoxin|nr:TlpA disulfide reductase family protein [Prolixibacteraceae bacterium]